MTSPNPPTTPGEAYQEVVIALGNLSAAITTVVTDPDYIASAADFIAELASAIPGIAEDTYDIARCGFDLFVIIAGDA
jgi:hypothetical protein